jgi:hypothetical protein
VGPGEKIELSLPFGKRVLSPFLGLKNFVALNCTESNNHNHSNRLYLFSTFA